MVVAVWPFLERYGWFVVFGSFVSYYVYGKFIKPKLDSVRKEAELKERKKFDSDVHSRSAAQLAEIRDRQQREHEMVAAEMKLKEIEKERQRLEEIRKQLGEESVLASALGSTEVRRLLGDKKKKMTPGEIIDNYINSKPIVMFSKSSCPFCRKAKSVFATFRLKSADYEYIELDERDDLPGELIQKEFITRYGSRSVPKVFIGGELIGGGDDTVALFQQGVLEQLVIQAIGPTTN